MRMTKNEMPDGSAPASQAEKAASSAAIRMIEAIRKLKPTIEARASAMEAERRMPSDLLQALRSLGVFRMFVPPSHGGLGLDLPSSLDILKTLARVEGSVGWTAMIGSGTALFAPLLSWEFYNTIYRNGSDVMFAGSTQPAGVAKKAEGGWRVTGRWPFASGCQHADWIGGHCIMTEDDVSATEQGTPIIRFFILPAPDWIIEDTWHVAGLRGTGSHHVELRDMFVPAENFVDFVDGIPCLTGPLYQAALQLLPLMHGAVAIGMAEGALDDVVMLAQTGRRQQRAATAMRDSELFQAELGRIEADLRAAQALLEIQTASHWRHALAGTLKDPALFVEASQAGVWISATCVRVADACFTLAGAAAVYETSPLQRRMRDLHVAAQHAIVHPRVNREAGMRLLGDDNPSLTTVD
jgi:alkylation response protein AidB-like acyl-CoA dehydrogenase